MKLLEKLRETRLTKSDVFYLFLKLTIAVLLIAGAGPLIGVLLIFVLNYLVELAILNIYGLHYINLMDKNVFYDQVSNRCQIMCGILIEKSDERTLRETFEEKLLRDNLRFRCCMTKVADNYYLKELSLDQLGKLRNENFQVREDIHSMEDASNLMSEMQNTYMLEDTP
jgi:hypothetical protein